MVHSSIYTLGRPVGDVSLYLSSLVETIGSAGTLTVPAFNNDFPQTKKYDPTRSAARYGALTEHVRTHSDCRQSIHPFCSLASIGRYASILSEIDLPSVIGPGTAYDLMVKLDFKILFLGKQTFDASIVHVAELEAEVPYRKWMDFSGKVRIGNTWVDRTYKMHVRDRSIGAVLDFSRITQWLYSDGVVEATKVNDGLIALCSMRSYLATITKRLKEDPWCLIQNREEAISRLARFPG